MLKKHTTSMHVVWKKIVFNKFVTLQSSIIFVTPIYFMKKNMTSLPTQAFHDPQFGRKQ